MNNTKPKKSKTVTENCINKSVRRAHAESDALFYSIGEGAITTDGKGHIARINDVALEILGYSAEEAVGNGTRRSSLPKTKAAESSQILSGLLQKHS